MDNRYGLMRQGSGLWKALRDGDFEEEDVWDVLRDKKESNSKIGKSIESATSVPKNLSSATRMIPRATNSGSSSNNSCHETKMIQQSAPVKIPDWSKISRTKSKKSSKKISSWHYDDDDEGENSDDDEEDDEEDDENENEDSGYNYKLPPHELVARRLARSQISSFSVLEGAGRTLKGRDLSKVRNAVLTKTGFLESP